jgi:predicted nucleotidyltransferase component of viral defense system
VLDRRLVEDVASRLDADAGLVEKDWHVVRAIGVLAAFDHGEVRPVFSGGTSLSKGWGLIKRFSEDIDFKVSVPTASSRSKERNLRRDYRERIVGALQAAEFELSGKVLKADEDRFFSADFAYPSEFGAGQGLRPHLRVEMAMQPSMLVPVERPIRSLIAELQQQPPEVAAFACVDPVETAADKLSALAWRVCARERGDANDDPTIIRHLHDLAALETHVTASPEFTRLVRQAAVVDTGRRGGRALAAVAERFAMMLDRLQRETFWADEYGEFVREVSFARPEDTIGFDAALAAGRRLVGRIWETE